MIKSKKGNLVQNPLLGIANAAAANIAPNVAKMEPGYQEGRKPLPAHLKLIQGNRGRRPIKPEVKVDAALPEPLPFLCHDAQEEWCRVAPMLYRPALAFMAPLSFTRTLQINH